MADGMSTPAATAMQQPLTRSACEAAGASWDEDANACAGGEGVVPAATAADDSLAGPQPLTRAACEAAGASWNDNANACAGGVAMVPAAAAAATMPEHKPAKAVAKKTKKKKVAKKRGHTAKKHVKKTHVEQPKKRKRPVLEWLKGKDNKS